MKTKEFTIIIPTFNEEENVETCLQSVFNQNLNLVDKVLVADNNSQDSTLKICKKYDVEIIPGGIPAVARNNGAKHAQTKYLLFLDADTVLPKNFIQNSLKNFLRQKAKVASFFIKPYPKDLFNSIMFMVYNILSFIISKISLPTITTAGCCILVEKKIHEKVNGFRKKMIVLEEYDYIKRIKKYGKFSVIPNYVLTSTRRFRSGKRFKQAIILFIYYFKWLFTGNVNNDFLGYWEKYDK